MNITNYQNVVWLVVGCLFLGYFIYSVFLDVTLGEAIEILKNPALFMRKKKVIEVLKEKKESISMKRGEILKRLRLEKGILTQKEKIKVIIGKTEEEVITEWQTFKRRKKKSIWRDKYTLFKEGDIKSISKRQITSIDGKYQINFFYTKVCINPGMESEYKQLLAEQVALKESKKKIKHIIEDVQHGKVQIQDFDIEKLKLSFN